MVRKLLQIGLTLGLLATLCAWPVSAYALDESILKSFQKTGWGLAYDISWYAPKKGTYVISTAAQLAGVAYLVNTGTESFAGATVVLANDIDLAGKQWVPIGCAWGNDPTYFRGAFNGNGKTVRNLYIDRPDIQDQALFGAIQNAAIGYLTVEGSVRGHSNVAGVVAYANGPCGMKFVTNRCTISAIGHTAISGTNYHGSAAGVLACLKNTSSGKAQFQRLINYGDIAGADKGTGGVFGYLLSDGGAVVSQCANYGNVSTTTAQNVTDDDAGVGGIIGATAIVGTYEVSECANSGNISVANMKSVGGIVGHLGGSSSYVSYSRNEGSIQGGYQAGGIAGALTAKNAQIASSINEGLIRGGSGGSVVGVNKGSANLFDNYFLDGTGRGIGGMGISLSELAMQSTVDNLNKGVELFGLFGKPKLAWEGSSEAAGGVAGENNGSFSAGSASSALGDAGDAMGTSLTTASGTGADMTSSLDSGEMASIDNDGEEPEKIIKEVTLPEIPEEKELPQLPELKLTDAVLFFACAVGLIAYGAFIEVERFRLSKRRSGTGAMVPQAA